MSHCQLVKIAARWLREECRCAIVITELVTTAPETADAIGWSYGGRHSCMIECKISRGDFFKDKAKGSRRMGQFKYYLVPKGLITIDELPEGWGLLEYEGTFPRDRQSRVIETVQAPASKPNRANEISVLYSTILRKCGKSTAPRLATIAVDDEIAEIPEISETIPPKAGSRACQTTNWHSRPHA
jgi:hypothetical protein